MKVVVFLQNAWSPKYAGKIWPRKSWLKALDASHSGQRLRSLVSGYAASGVEWWYDNASPLVSVSPKGFEKADIHHIRKVVLKQRPDVVIALGKEASRGVMAACADHPLVILAPHPASRVLTSALYRDIGQHLWCLSAGFSPIEGCTLVSYRQEQGRVVIQPDPWLVHKSKAEN